MRYGKVGNRQNRLNRISNGNQLWKKLGLEELGLGSWNELDRNQLNWNPLKRDDKQGLVNWELE